MTFKKILITALLMFLITGSFYAQLTVTSATACPNQTVTLNASWPNVSSITYTISRSVTSFTPQGSSSFTVSDPGPAQVVYTIVGNGTALSGPVSATTTASLTIVAPQPLTVTPAYASYCYGGQATLTALPAGSSFNYSVTPPATAPGVAPSNINVININNLTSPANNGQYTVTANIGGCIRTGTATISVAPNSQMQVSPSTVMCQQLNNPAAGYVLSATLTSGTGFYWSGPGVNAAQQTYALGAPNYTQTGVYQVTANIAYTGVNSSVQCFRSGTTSVTVIETATPVLSASPSGTICQGSNLTLVANAVLNSGGVGAYAWGGPQGFSSTVQNPVIANVGPGSSGNYTATAYFFGPITCTTKAAINVSVVATADPNPIAPPNICQNETATLSVSAPGTTNFSWSGPNNFSATSATNTIANIQPVASGPYYVTAIFTLGNVTCTKTKSVTINVIPVNTISVIPPADVCQPGDVYLQASSIGASNYTWTGPGGVVGYMATMPIYHPPLSASGIYTVTAGFSGGAITCYNTNTVSVTIKPLLNFTLAPSVLVCYNSNVHVDGPAGATTYNWTSSNGFTATSQNIDLLQVQPANAGTYSLTVSLNGCVTSATTGVDVLSSISFVNPFYETTICRGDSVHFQVPVTGGTNNYAYWWDPSIYLASTNGSVNAGVPLGTTIYNVTVHDIVCPENTISGSFIVNVNQPPLPNLQLDRIEGCAPLTQVYKANTDSASTMWITYDFGGNHRYQFINPVLSGSIPLNDPGTYTLNVITTGTNHCSGTFKYPQPINVYPTPKITIVTDPETPTITDNVIFGVSTDYSVTSQMWVFNNGSTLPADTLYTPNPVKTFIDSGIYPVYVSVATDMGCGDTTAKFVEIREDFNVFIPNSFTPNDDHINDVFRMKGSGINPNNFLMELMDRRGHTMYATRDIEAGWDGTINGTKVPPGVYVYKIQVVGAHSEGKKQYVGQFTLIR